MGTGNFLHPNHTHGRLKSWTRSMARDGASSATWEFMWMTCCWLARTTSLTKPSKHSRRNSLWQGLNGSRRSTRSPSVAMRSPRPTMATLWGKASTSEISSTSTTSAKQLQYPAQRSKKGKKNPLKSCLGQHFVQHSNYVGNLWLTTRTRPDIAFTVGHVKIAAQMVCLCERHVCVKYLCANVDKKFHYRGDGATDVLEVMVDASFGPPHEGYRSVQGIMMTHGGNALRWASTRQPFITQRTAGAELLAYNEAFQVGESTGVLLEVRGYGGVKMHMQGESKSGTSQLTADTGAWRTRHLRLRSAKLREVIQSRRVA